MASAGKALRYVLDAYGISQNQLALKMGIKRSSIHHWVHELAALQAEAVLSMRNALEQIAPEADKEVFRLYSSDPDEAKSPQPRVCSKAWVNQTS